MTEFMSPTRKSSDMIPATYYHEPTPPGFPQPWWLQAMRQLWHTIGQLMLMKERR